MKTVKKRVNMGMKGSQLGEPFIDDGSVLARSQPAVHQSTRDTWKDLDMTLNINEMR